MTASPVFEFRQGIRYISYLDDSGYGIAARSLLKILTGRNIPLTWQPMARTGDLYRMVEVPVLESGMPELVRLYKNGVPYDVTVMHTVPFYYPPVIDEVRKAGGKIYGHTVWETDRLPASWVSILNRLDGVIVPTLWNREVFMASGVTVPIAILPHVSQFGGSAPDAPPISLPGIDPDTFVFYTIGEWNERKIMEKMIGTYMRTFARDENVCLIIKTSRTDWTSFGRSFRTFFRRRHQPLLPKIARLREKYRSSARMIILTEQLTDNVIRQLHNRGDCFVSLCRSEGWGLGAYEAAWFGKPVIMTGYGGQLDFLPSHLAYLAGYQLTGVRFDPGYPEYEDGQKWAEPDQESGARLMREVFSDPAVAKYRGACLRKFVGERFDSNLIADTFSEVFRSRDDRSTPSERKLNA